jgi:hypothetical protein
MTQSEFDGLPGLLTRRQFLAATGLDRYELRILVSSEVVTMVSVARLCGMKRKQFRGKYPKWQAARLGQWAFDGANSGSVPLEQVLRSVEERLRRIESNLNAKGNKG